MKFPNFFRMDFVLLSRRHRLLDTRKLFPTWMESVPLKRLSIKLRLLQGVTQNDKERGLRDSRLIMLDTDTLTIGQIVDRIVDSFPATSTL